MRGFRSPRFSLVELIMELMGSKPFSSKKLAERVGFEPTLEFPLNTLSKRAPSATRPSLRRYREATAMQARTCSSRFYVAWASVATGTQIRQEIRALKTMRASSCRLFLDSKNLALLWTGTEVGLWSVLLGLVLQARLVSHPAALDCSNNKARARGDQRRQVCHRLYEDNS